MKNFKKSIVLLLFSAVFGGMLVATTSCSKDESNDSNYVCETCATSPEALAVNDNSAKGIYKGIVVGSTGTISINIQNGSNTITATMVLDGVSVALTSNVSVVDGETLIAPFTGTFNGSPVSITFQVGSGGEQPTMVSSDIPGHPNTVFELFKESSTSLIEAFVGTYSVGGDTGTFNIVVARSLNKWGYIAKDDNSGEIHEGSGSITGGNHLLNEEGLDIATINGDEVHGTSTDGNGDTLLIDGDRTL